MNLSAFFINITKRAFFVEEKTNFKENLKKPKRDKYNTLL